MNKGDFVIVTKTNELRFLPVGFLSYANMTDSIIGEIKSEMPDMLDCEIILQADVGIVVNPPLTIRDVVVKYNWCGVFTPKSIRQVNQAELLSSDDREES